MKPAFWFIAFAVAALFALFLRGLSADSERNRSVFSPRAGGRLAAYLLLRELDFAPRAWRRAPGHLPRGEHLLWLPDAPQEPPVYLRRIWKEMDAAPESADGGFGRRPPVTRRLRDPHHYLRFIEEGGTLLCGLDDARREFLVGDLGLVEIEAIESFHDAEDRSQQVAVTRTGETIECAWDGRRGFRPLELGSPFEMLIADDRGDPLALRLELGRGALALIPDDGFLDNRALGDAQNALLFVRLLEHLRPPGEFLVDEYALGGWVPESALELALSPSNFALSAHLLLFCCLLVWSVAWPRQFPRDPEPIARISPLSRATSHGALLVSHRRWGVLASMLRRGVLRRLPNARRFTGAEGEDLGHSVRLALSSLSDRARGADQLEAWRRALLPGPVQGYTELEALGATLSEIERLARAGQKGHNDGEGEVSTNDGR